MNDPKLTNDELDKIAIYTCPKCNRENSAPPFRLCKECTQEERKHTCRICGRLPVNWHRTGTVDDMIYEGDRTTCKDCYNIIDKFLMLEKRRIE